jgi:hypothetical protein
LQLVLSAAYWTGLLAFSEDIFTLLAVHPEGVGDLKVFTHSAQVGVFMVPQCRLPPNCLGASTLGAGAGATYSFSIPISSLIIFFNSVIVIFAIMIIFSNLIFFIQWQIICSVLILNN